MMREIFQEDKVTIFKRKHRKRLQQGDQTNQLTLERRACSNLFDLSQSSYESNINPEKKGLKNISKETLYSPWKNKLNNKDSSLLGQKKDKKRIKDLQHLKNAHFFSRKCSMTKLNDRIFTEPKEKLCSMPKLVNTQVIVFQSEQASLIQLKSDSKSQKSHKVLHVTHTLKNNTEELNLQKASNRRNIVSHCPIVEKKTRFQEKSLKSQEKDSRCKQKGWCTRVKTLKCAKKKRMNRLHSESELEHKFFSAKVPLTLKVDAYSGPNPVSRVLLQKYLLICEEGNKQNISK